MGNKKGGRSGLKKNLNSNLHLGQVLGCPFNALDGTQLVLSVNHWTSENGNLLAQKENPLVLDDRMSVFLSLVIIFMSANYPFSLGYAFLIIAAFRKHRTLFLLEHLGFNKVDFHDLVD